MIKTTSSILEEKSFKGLDFYLKRDDLLGELNGNKARKLAYLLQNPPAPGTKIISYGSNQGNAMLALSIFAKNFGLIFKYLARPLSSFLRAKPLGNLKLALENDMILIEEKGDLYKKAKSLKGAKDLLIPQGIAHTMASLGYKELSFELDNQSKAFLKEGERLSIFLPSGTGTSAKYLAKYTKHQVYTTPCVGSSSYLREQIRNSEAGYDFSRLSILNPPKKWHFAKLYKEFYQLYKELLEDTGVEFDLLYDMVGFHTLLSSDIKGKLIYIHQGGLEGNASMLARYAHNFKFEIS